MFWLCTWCINNGEKSWPQGYKWVGNGGGQTCEDGVVGYHRRWSRLKIQKVPSQWRLDAGRRCEAVFYLPLVSLTRSAAAGLSCGCISMHGQWEPQRKSNLKALTLAMEAEFPVGQSWQMQCSALLYLMPKEGIKGLTAQWRYIQQYSV